MIPIPLEGWRNGDEWRRVVDVHVFTAGRVLDGTVTYVTTGFKRIVTSLTGWLDWAKDAERAA